jgi:D-glycero-D-manno-heptose 1,7-bisphosphate phosphatase
MSAAVFLDRDNTVIHNDADLGDPHQVHLIQGAASAISSLCGLGYRVIVVSNQGGVARGQFDEADVDAVNERVRQLVQQASNGARIERFYYCPYHPEGSVEAYAKEHPNRKPQPGMLLEAADELGLDLSQSWMVGDQMRDVEAGVAAGTRTVLLAEPAGGAWPDEEAGTEEAGGTEHPARPNYVARNLIEAVRIIAQQRKPDGEEGQRTRGTTAKRWDADAIAQVQHEPTPEARAATGQNVEATPHQPNLYDETDDETAAADTTTASMSTVAANAEEDEPVDHSQAEPDADADNNAEASDADAEPAGHLEPTDDAGGETEPAPEPAKAKRKPTRYEADPTEVEPGVPARPHASQGRSKPGGSSDQTRDEASRSKSNSSTPSAPSASSEVVMDESASTSNPTQAEPVAGTSPSPQPNQPGGASAAPSSNRLTSSTRRPRGQGVTAAGGPQAAGEQTRDPDKDDGALAERLLRSILQELRNQRGGRERFSYLTVVAIVLQMIAGVCLIGGLLMGGDAVLFFKWISVGLMMQLATLAALLFSRNGA